MKLISRAQFLRGDWAGNKQVTHPPWALAGGRFADACDSCGDCVTACPQNILKQSARGLPQVSFLHGECTFCGDCAAACPTGALNRDSNKIELAWQLTAQISDECLALNGTTCVRCIESCAVEAIVARPSLRGQSHLQVMAETCNGCGACYAGCPVNAITLEPGKSTRAQGGKPKGEYSEPYLHQ
jgi:ferredoxin-type protein NapF